MDRLDFSDEELDIIDQITITLALVFEKVMKNVGSEGLLSQSSKMTSFLRYQTTVAYAIKLLSLYHDQSRFTGEIKEEIAKMLSEKHQQDLLKNESLMSKVLKNFDNNGVTFRIRGDKNIKTQLSTNNSRKPKAKRPRRVGTHTISKLTRTVENYKRVLSNPKGLDLINCRLLKYGLLSKTYSTIIRESFYAFKEGDENFYNNLKMFKVLFPNIDDDSMLDSKLFQERIKALSEAELENLQQQVTTYFVENPNYPVFFIFSLYKFGN
ncbi:MAG: hypothetical protein WA941_14785 [Nitrososphaeraceae archaeon]